MPDDWETVDEEIISVGVHKVLSWRWPFTKWIVNCPKCGARVLEQRHEPDVPTAFGAFGKHISDHGVDVEFIRHDRDERAT